MTDPVESAASLETRADAGPGPQGLVKLWLEAIGLATKDEEPWVKAARKATETYRDAKGERTQARFNILFSNTETMVPAIYNSAPIPDVRRRYGDEDPAGKIAGQVVERAVSYEIDTHDLNLAMQCAVKDMVLSGRGVTRVRYLPVVDADKGVTQEGVGAEHVQWEDFRHGPGRRWEDVPWIAFCHLLTREQVTALNAKVGPSINLDMTTDGKETKKEDDANPSDIFKRLLVWEIWDKDKRERLFIAPSYKAAPLVQEADPLKLQGFFPIPRPLLAIETTDSLVPIEPYRLYKDQAEELDRITRRINALVKVLKWRGIRAVTEDDTAFDSLKNAEDGDLVPATSVMSFATSGGGLDKAIWLMPIEQAAQVVKELYLARDQVKQTIYEITGIADILRGATDANETATAQQIKAQWGSLRIQRLQAEVARYARDLIRLMVEVICTRFDWQTLSAMTQTQLPTQAEKQQAQQIVQMAAQAGAEPPVEALALLEQLTVEEVEAVLRSDIQRCYRVDVETDSTIRADVLRQQENLANFVTGFGSFITAVGPAVEAGVMQVDEATDLLTGFARSFKLGRQAEDALDRLGKRALEMSKNPQPPKEDPKIALERQKLEMQGQSEQAKLQMEGQRQQNEFALAQQKQAHEMQLAERNAVFQEEQAAQQTAFEQQRMQQEGARADREFGLKQEETVAKVGMEAAKLRDGQQARQEQAKEADKQRRAEGLPVAEELNEEDMGKVADALMALAQAMKENTEAQREQTETLIKAATATKRVIRDKNGRAEGVQTVLN